MKDRILIEGLPSITIDKKDKLVCFLKKKITECTKIKNINIDLIIDDNEVKDFFFLEHDKAKDMVPLLDNYTLDKKHKLKCLLTSEIPEILNTPDEYIPLNYSINSVDNMYDYIDKWSCPQFIVYTEDDISFHKNNYQVSGQKNFIQTIPHNITDLNNIKYLNFSNTGKYLYTITNTDVKIYIRNNLTFFTSFDINEILAVKFSGNDTYIAIYDGGYIYIYDILSIKLIRKVKSSTYDISFSRNEEYFIYKNLTKLIVVNIYNNKIKHIDDVDKVSVSSSSNLLVYFKKFIKDKPSQITVLELSKELPCLMNKTVYDLSNIFFYWNNNKLATIIKRNGKKDLLNIFTISNDISTYILELDHICVTFSWCLATGRYAILDNKYNFIVYNNKHKETLKLTNKRFKQINWSPLGDYVILSNILYDSEVELFNILKEDDITKISFKGCTYINWDPSGRFFILYSSKYFINKSNSYKLYTFQGTLLDEKNINKLFAIFWRNTPNDIVTNSKKIKIKNNITKYKDILEDITRYENTLASDGSLMNKRLQQLNDYRYFESLC